VDWNWQNSSNCRRQKNPIERGERLRRFYIFNLIQTFFDHTNCLTLINLLICIETFKYGIVPLFVNGLNALPWMLERSSL